MKKTQLDRAIEQLESEKRILEMAIEKLRQQQAHVPARKRKASMDLPRTGAKLAVEKIG